MAQITSGKVTYSRTVQPAQYESKKAEIELTFVMAEGEKLGDMLDQVSEVAKNKVLELVGLKTSEKRHR